MAAAQARIEAAAAAANAAKVATLTEQWGDAAGIAVEGHADPEFNGVYRHDAAASAAFAEGWGPAGWPVGKNEHGKFLYHTARLDGWPGDPTHTTQRNSKSARVRAPIRRADD